MAAGAPPACRSTLERPNLPRSAALPPPALAVSPRTPDPGCSLRPLAGSRPASLDLPPRAAPRRRRPQFAALVPDQGDRGALPAPVDVVGPEDHVGLRPRQVLRDVDV